MEPFDDVICRVCGQSDVFGGKYSRLCGDCKAACEVDALIGQWMRQGSLPPAGPVTLKADYLGAWRRRAAS